MRKVHGRKQAVSWSLAGAVTGGLVLYGAVWLGRKLVAAPMVQRVAHFVRVIVAHSAKPAAAAASAETVFQADAGGGAGWTPPAAPNVYGPN